MKKLKEWFLDVDDDVEPNTTDHQIRVVSITAIHDITNIMNQVKNDTLVVTIKEPSIEQRTKDILNGFLLGCNGYIYEINSSTIIISTKIII